MSNIPSNFYPVLSEENDIIQPFILGCDTKSLRVVQISLTALQRLISHQAVSEVFKTTLCVVIAECRMRILC